MTTPKVVPSMRLNLSCWKGEGLAVEARNGYLAREEECKGSEYCMSREDRKE